MLWFWDRSASRDLLEQASQEIPGTDRHLRADVIGTSFDTKLRTSLAGDAYIPDITYINSNNALYFTNEDLFLDLSELGADSVKDDYYEWKWNLGTTPTGRFCFFPLDIGPTGYFYRQDIFEEAGLPSTPAEVSAAITTWEDWIALGTELEGAADAFLVNDALNVFEEFLNASPERFFDTDDKALYFAARQRRPSGVGHFGRRRRGRCERPRSRGNATPTGTLPGPAAAPPGTSGRPGGPRSSSSPLPTPPAPGASRHSRSVLATAAAPSPRFPHTCKDPEAALAFITWINSPENQAAAYQDESLFPSTPASFEDLTYSGDFYGDQDPLAFFSTAAESVPSSFISNAETFIMGKFVLELSNVETSGKDSEAAWNDAIGQAERVLLKRGVFS